MFGYTDVDSSGGQGCNTSGGTGGSINLHNSYSTIHDNVNGPGGGVVNYAKLSARGGNGSSGGRPGSASMSTQDHYAFGVQNEQVLNFGDVDVSGGDASSSTSTIWQGGYLSLNAMTHLENHGRLISNGDTQSGGPRTGGNGGSINLYSNNGPVTNTGALHANAGSATGAGGYGGSVSLWGTVTNNSAAVTATGGNSTVQGGAGGGVSFTSYSGQSANTGSVVVRGGNGTPPGQRGTFTLDGANQ